MKFKNRFNLKLYFQGILASFIAVLVVAAAAGAATTVSNAVTVGTDLTVTSGARVGTGTTPGHITALADDSLLVEGQAEFDGTVWFDGTVHSIIASTTDLRVFQTDGTTPRFNASSTAISIGDGNPVAGFRFGTCTVTIASVTASSTASVNCTATGVTTSDEVFITPYITDPTIIFTSASSTAADTIQISVYNTGTVGAVDPADNTWSWMAIR